MSTKTVPTFRAPRKRTDRRVTRTRDLLGDALVALIQEMPFREITVQHVLDRAGVSRSTFYSHFSNKDDLFVSDLEDFLEKMAFALSRHGDKSFRVAPVQELFAHVAEWRKLHGALIKAGKLRDFMELGQGMFARGIEQRLGENSKTRDSSPVHRTAVAQMFGAALMSLLSWWLAQGAREAPVEMDRLFHQALWQGLGVPDWEAAGREMRVVRKRI
jgi:AcrR family transcriptional regulator